jgi:hypothetical protein
LLYGPAEVEEGDRLKKVEKLEKVLPVEEALQLDSCSVWLEEKECGTLYTVLICHSEEDMRRAVVDMSAD